MIHRRLTVRAPTQGLCEITELLCHEVCAAGIDVGLCHVFIHHTSASLIIQENADPDVQHDLNAFFARLVPEGDPLYRHTAEGPDDMPAHVRSVLTQTSLSIPITDGGLALGTWQGVYLWEHRARPTTRQLTVTIQGV